MGHDKTGVGVPSSYRKDANNKVDVLWKVKIKGRKFLADNIPLHMSLRVFDYLDRKDMEKVKDKLEEINAKIDALRDAMNVQDVVVKSYYESE